MNQTEKLKMHSTVVTPIGTGVTIGRSFDWEEILVAFQHEDLNPEWLAEHSEIQGNPHLWVNREDIIENLGFETPAQLSKKRKPK